MDILNTRVTYRDSPIHVLERFAFRDMGEAYREFRRHPEIGECVILQTCNRVELYSTGSDLPRIKRAWASLTGLREGDFDGNLECSEGDGACRHLLRVASGLDSMVVGEEQVLGQVRGSISAARRAGSSGQTLNTLFEKAVHAGARIRSASGIGSGGVSVGSMAVRLADESSGGLESKRVLVVGTGETASLVAKSLSRRGVDFEVSSRTVRRAGAFCQSLGGRPVRFEDALDELPAYGVVFVATSAPYSLVTPERLSGADMSILDLSNPRAVSEEVASVPGVSLMNLDQIAAMVERNVRGRMEKAGMAEEMVEEEAGALEASIKRLGAEPLVERVFKGTEAVRKRELQKALKMLGLDERGERIVDELTRAVAEGILAPPMNSVRRASKEGRTDVLDAADGLFRYDGQS